MNTAVRLLLLTLALAWSTAAPVAAADPANDRPRITSITYESDALLVVAEIPDGIVRVVLEGCSRSDFRGWIPRAVEPVSGPGTVTFRISLQAAQGLEVFRVRADDSAPLPANFFSGRTEFNGSAQGTAESSTLNTYYLRGADGSGAEVIAPGAAGDGAAPAPSDSPRDVVESDLWRLQGDTLYLFNHQRGLQIIDVAHPDAPVVRATFPLPASGEDMYLLGSSHVLLLARARPCDWNWATSQESAVVVVDVSGSTPREIARVPVRGHIIESRLVGSALYLATDTWQPESRNGTETGNWINGTLITGIDLADPAQPAVPPTLWFPGSGNVVTASPTFLFVATTDYQNQSWWSSVLRVIDITDPAATLREFASIPLRGRLQDKFKVHVHDDILTTIVAGPENGDQGGRWRTLLQTYRLADPRSAAPVSWSRLGAVEVGHGESLFATRFDGTRAYIVTFLRIDPLWIVDLANPEKPVVLGELEIPGWSTYIHPMGDRLLTVGIDDTQGTRTAVQLFDVADPAAPRLLSKVPLGQGWSSSEANQTEKALGVFPNENLVLLPFTSASGDRVDQGVQLIDLGRDTLTARGIIRSDRVVPRRSTLLDSRILTISSRELVTADATDRDQPLIKNTLELAFPVQRVLPVAEFLIEVSDTSLRVRRPADDESDATVHSIGSTPVLAAETRDQRLYLLQGTAATGQWQETNWAVNTPGKLTLTVYDVSRLPDLAPLGSTTTETSDTAFSTYTALWPSPEVLVWAASDSSFPYLWDIALPILRGGAPGLVDRPGVINFDGASDTPGVVTPSAAVADGFAAPINDRRGIWWWPRPTSDLLVYTVANPAAPALASRIPTPTDAISRSRAFTAGGQVYFSHDTQRSEIIGTNSYTYLTLQWVDEPRVVTLTNYVRVPYEVLITNIFEERVTLTGWAQPLPATRSLAAGAYHALALLESGEVVGWGDNRAGQLGIDPLPSHEIAEPLPLPGPATTVAAAGWFSVARLDDGSVWAWGQPDGPSIPPFPTTLLDPDAGPHPRPVSGLPDNVVDLAAGQGHVLARTSKGQLFGWGRNSSGQLGVGDLEDRPAPVAILENIETISAGGLHSLARSTDGKVYGWGDNSSGQAGSEKARFLVRPVEISGLPAVQAIAAGDWHSLALDISGRVWAWGDDGDPKAADPSGAPRLVTGLPAIEKIAAGRHHSVALDSQGRAWSWGAHSPVPLPMESVPPLLSVQARGGYGLGLAPDHTALVWQLGDYPAPASLNPQKFTLAQVLGTNVFPGTEYRIETNIITKTIDGGHYFEVLVTNTYPVYRFWTLHHLNVADVVTDPAQPILRPVLSIPGALQGLSHDGALLYTLDSRTDPALPADQAVWNTWLEAVAYDGVAAHYVAGLQVANASRGESATAAVDPRGWVLLARQDANGAASLASLTLSQDGKFATADSRPLDAYPYSMLAYDGFAALRSNGDVLLFDLTGEGRLLPTGIPLHLGCFATDLFHLEGDRQAGLWIPLGDYGSAKLWEP